jgi:probable addiction module antidote protein
VAATRECNLQTLSGHWNISKITKKRPERHETQSQHLARRGYHSTAPERPGFCRRVPQSEDEPRVLLLALRYLAQAQGIAKVAKAAGIERESLYRALSIHGNPRLSTLIAVTKAIGLRLTVEAAH